MRKEPSTEPWERPLDSMKDTLNTHTHTLYTLIILRKYLSGSSFPRIFIYQA